VADDRAQLFEEARRLAATDREAAIELFKRVVDLPPGPEWADAQLEVAGWAHQRWELAEARQRFQSIIDADPAVRTNEAWRTAVVMLNNVLDAMEQPIDDDLLRRGLEACEAANRPHDAYLAGVAASHLARIEEAAGRLDTALAYFMRAEPNYNAAGSMIGGPGAAYRIAKLLVARGDLTAAHEWLQRGLDHLAKFPLGGRNVREMQRKLEALAAAAPKDL
jgi:tetratricopeptide (TPR) repeat protein